MSNEGCGLGCVNGCALITWGVVAAAGALAASLLLGPVDFGRSVYNEMIGDTPVLKRQLTNYCRQGITRYYEDQTGSAETDPEQIERVLAREVGAVYREGKKVDPTEAGTNRLWNCSEDYAKGFYDQWIWTKLSKY